MKNKNSLNLGIIGNCKSAALINEDSSIDWCCLPQFDSPSVFGKIIDEKIGGSFKVECDPSYQIKQSYIENTNILRTRFSQGENIFELLDFMPRYQKEDGLYYAPPELTRVFKHISGSPNLKIIYDPRLEYAIGETNNYIKEDFIVSVVDDKHYDTLFLYTDFDKESVLSSEEFTLEKDQFTTVSYNEKINVPALENTLLEYERTKVYWLNWCHKTPNFKKLQSGDFEKCNDLKAIDF